MNGPILTGQVALIEDDYTLVINRGAEAGVTPGMIFAVSSGPPQVVTDPESGRELGRISREKLRVRVFDVQPLFARAHTFVDSADFRGLLALPFVEQAEEDVVTVDIVTASNWFSGRSTTHRANGIRAEQVSRQRAAAG